MSKVTRIAYSKNLNQGKYDHLSTMARRLGRLRTEVWDRYGSMAGVGLSHRDVRDEWLTQEREFDTQARVWKQTLSDVFGDIEAAREAAKSRVRRVIWRKYPDDDAQRKRLFTLNDGIRLLNDPAIIDTLNGISVGSISGKPMVEVAVEWKVEDVPVPVIGFVDCITTDGVVCDFKTTARSWPQDRAAQEIQPAVYLAALTQMGLITDPWRFRHIVFVRTKTPKVDVFETERSYEELAWAQGLVRDVWRGIESGFFAPNPFTWKCAPGNCEFWEECRG